MRRINLDNKKDLVEKLLKEEVSRKNISKTLGCSISTLRLWIEKWGFSHYRRRASTRGMSQPKLHRFSSDIEDEIIKMYLSGRSAIKIANTLKCSDSTISTILTRNNIHRRGISEAGKLVPRKYSFREDYFSSIDSNDKAYWLGMIGSDGHIRKDSNQLLIELKSTDIRHLEKFIDAIDYKGKIHHYSHKNKNGTITYSSVVRLTSEKLVNSLVENGIPGGAKSLIYKPWGGPSYLLSHYWRGMIDGDGCIKNRKSKNSIQWRVGLTGTEEVCIGFRQFLYSCEIKSTGCLYNHGNYSEIVYSGNRVAREIITILQYNTGNIQLDRKGLLAIKLAEE